MRWLRKSPVQTFVFVPLATIAWEWAITGALRIHPVFALLMLWGYLQYRLCGRYRIALGGGGPGLSGAPPERLVETGIYAWTRNPMYLGHIIYMIGVALTFQSLFAAVIAIARSRPSRTYGSVVLVLTKASATRPASRSVVACAAEPL